MDNEKSLSPLEQEIMHSSLRRSVTPEPKPDWAEALTDEILNGKGYLLYGQELKDRVAQYLREVARKNKAEGMREAMKIAMQTGVSSGPYHAIERASDKLDPPPLPLKST